MKKTVAAVLALLLTFLICPAALAQVDIQVSPSPQVLTEPGFVSMTFRVMNTSANSMENIGISGYGISGSKDLTPGPIVPTQGLNFSLQNIEVVAGMVGQPLEFTLHWTENGAAMSQSVSVSLSGTTAVAPDMTGKVTADKASGAEGDKIKLTYALTNPAAVPMTNVVLKDTLAADKDIAGNATIAAGETKEFTYEYTLGSADAKSTPTVTYQVNGENKSLTIAPLTVSVVSIKLNTVVSQGETTPEGTQFSIVLRNEGNQTISKIQVTDEQGNKVNKDTFSLASGKEESLTYNVVTDTLRNVAFTITGIDAQNQPYENKTKSYAVTPYVDPSTISISLLTAVVQPLSDSGRIVVKFTVQNNSATELQEAVISEAEYGVVETIGVLAAGEYSVEKELLIGGPRELQFTLTAKDPSGAAHTYDSKLNAAYVTLATETPAAPTDAAPEVTPEPAAQPTGISGTLLTVLIVLAVLMAVAGIALLALSMYEKKNNRRGLIGDSDDDYDDDDGDDDIGFDEKESLPYAKPKQTVSRKEAEKRPVTPPAAKHEKPAKPAHAPRNEKPAPQPRAAQQPPMQKPQQQKPVPRPQAQPQAPQQRPAPVQRPAQPVSPSYNRPTAPVSQPPVQTPINSYQQPQAPIQPQTGYAPSAPAQAPQTGYRQPQAPVPQQNGYPQQPVQQPIQQPGYAPQPRPTPVQQGYASQPPVQAPVSPQMRPQQPVVQTRPVQQPPMQKPASPVQEVQATRPAGKNQVRRVRPVDQDDQ